MGLMGCPTSVWTALKRLMAKRARAASGAAGWALPGVVSIPVAGVIAVHLIHRLL
jgi:hypothetical protein